ncbi:MAG: glucose 1-dehydrogenase [Rubrivivax sp.]
MGMLDGQVAIITGGASGIGEASVRRFVAEGAQVLMADVQDDRGQRLAAELGPCCRYRHADVTQAADVQALVDQAMADHGRLDCLFNNAGAAGAGGPIEEVAPEAWDATMALLLRSVYLGLHFAAPVMKRQRRGSLISTASVAGLQANFGPHAYSAAKAAVIQLTRSVATELGESGVRVNCICPGGIATPIFGKGMGLSAEQADATVAPMRQVLAGMQPLPRAGLPDDIAQAALWLASDASSFVNGHALVVDGGLTAGRGWSVTQQRHEQLRAAFGAGR